MIQRLQQRAWLACTLMNPQLHAEKHKSVLRTETFVCDESTVSTKEGEQLERLGGRNNINKIKINKIGLQGTWNKETQQAVKI